MKLEDVKKAEVLLCSGIVIALVGSFIDVLGIIMIGGILIGAGFARMNRK